MHLESLVVDENLEPAVRPVKLGSTWFVLMEASANAAVAYRNAGMRSAVIGEDGSPTVNMTVADVEPVLVAGCLAYARFPNGIPAPDGSGNLIGTGEYATKADRTPAYVPEAVVRGWPSRIQKKLFALIKDMSPGLIETDDETEAELDKTIASATRRRDKLRAIREGKAAAEDPAPKGPPAATTGTSA